MGIVSTKHMGARNAVFRRAQTSFRFSGGGGEIVAIPVQKQETRGLVFVMILGISSGHQSNQNLRISDPDHSVIVLAIGSWI